MFIQFTGCNKPVQRDSVFIGQKMQLTSGDNANNMRNAKVRGHKLQLSGRNGRSGQWYENTTDKKLVTI